VSTARARVRRATLVLAGLWGAHTPLAAQGATSSCPYEQCALSIVPAWNGLAVARGAQEERLATLGFVWAGSLRHVFDGDADAVRMGERAVRTRHLAAALTDVGALLLAAGAIRAADDRRTDAASTALLGAGGVLFVASVPLQFKADGQLSRAVWLFNRRFARSP
jgi:hypothetical protein